MSFGIPEIRSTLQDTGNTMASKLVDLTIGLLCTGIFTPLYIMAIYTIIEHNTQSLHSRATLVIISFSLLTSLAYTGLNWMSSIPRLVFFNGGFWASSYVSVSEANNLHMNAIPISMLWLSTFPLVFNDAIIIWRAWLIFDRQRWTLMLAVGLCICSFGIMLVYLILCSLFSLGHGWSSGSPARDQGFADIRVSTIADVHADFLGYIFFGLSLSTNAVATLLIGMTLQRHLRFLQKIQISRKRFMGSWRILNLLLESGAIYCVLQVWSRVYAIHTQAFTFLQLVMFSLQFLPVTSSLPSYYGYLAFAALYRGISFVYPTLTILFIREVSSIRALHNSVITLQISKEHLSA
ncbi:hypothetical protein H2248_010272 [Termitomyces sp. 'cryptogamus']|nr:hypothetical protein H2248_010272 [Termitomyces sp. 'cryptogamus']